MNLMIRFKANSSVASVNIARGKGVSQCSREGGVNGMIR